MTRDLKEAQIVVGVATNDCNALLETIASSTGEVETKQANARIKEQQLQVHFALDDTCCMRVRGTTCMHSH